MAFPPPTERQARLIWSALTGLALATLAGLVVALIWALGRVLDVLGPVLWPLAVAGVIAYLLDPVVDWLERRRVPRPRAILCVFVLALVVVAGVAGSVLPRIITETRELVQRVPVYAERVERQLDAWIRQPPALLQRLLRLVPGAPQTPPSSVTNAPAATNLAADATAPSPQPAGPAAPVPTPSTAPAEPIGGATTNLVAWAREWGRSVDPAWLNSATGWLAAAAQKIGAWLFGQMGRVASWAGLLIGLFLIPIYAFYFLLEKRGIESKWTDYLPLAHSALKEELAFVLRSINDYLIAFFRGQVLVAICDGILYAAGFSLIGLPYAVLLGAVATVLTLIPFVGAAVTCVSALVIAVVSFGDWLHPLLALGVYAVVQLLEGFVIQPKIMGDRVGLHPLTIIIALMVGTTLLGGILGAILAIPLTAALRVVMFRYVWTGRREAVPAR
jgi:predicted PurR-regulated permease PerM